MMRFGHLALVVIAWSAVSIAQQSAINIKHIDTRDEDGTGTFVRWEKENNLCCARVYLKSKDGKQIACDDGFKGELPAYASGDAVDYSLSWATYNYRDGSSWQNPIPMCQIKKPESTFQACKKLPQKEASKCFDNWRAAGNSP